jgi:hypothetical protein
VVDSLYAGLVRRIASAAYRGGGNISAVARDNEEARNNGDILVRQRKTRETTQTNYNHARGHGVRPQRFEMALQKGLALLSTLWQADMFFSFLRPPFGFL